MTSDSIPESTIAILLAAGAGSRFRGPTHKLLASLPGEEDRTIFEVSLSVALTAGFSKVIVVSGAADIPAPLVRDPRVVLVHNHRWSEGQAHSLNVGIAEAQRLGATAVVVGLADQPFISAEAWRLVATSDSPIAVATYGGRRGNPVRLAASTWALLPTTGDTGARDLITLRPELVSQVDCPGSAADIDTEEDLAQWT
jgi:CTP:molybdopterin cytidylyltransferase MocA